MKISIANINLVCLYYFFSESSFWADFKAYNFSFAPAIKKNQINNSF